MNLLIDLNIILLIKVTTHRLFFKIVKITIFLNESEIVQSVCYVICTAQLYY